MATLTVQKCGVCSSLHHNSTQFSKLLSQKTARSRAVQPAAAAPDAGRVKPSAPRREGNGETRRAGGGGGAGGGVETTALCSK